MAKARDQSSQPTNERPTLERGGASFAQAAQWQQESLNEIHRVLGRLEEGQRAIVSQASSADTRTGKVEDELRKLNTRLAWAVGAIAGAAVVIAFFFGSDFQTIWDSIQSLPKK